MKIDPSIFQPLIDQKLVSVQKHPEFDYYIYNYTHKAQFEGIEAWTPELRMCRGLILDGEGSVIARPFDKFFNLEQHQEVPNLPFKAYDKLDGSLGILYKRPDGEYAIATRGSFLSEQAIEATKMLRQLPHLLSDDVTHMVEIIYPENRVVVDYGSERKLVYLGARDIETGEIYTPDQFPSITNWMESSQQISDYQKPRENSEGVVLYYDNGFMCKVKYEEYVRLHRLVTGVNKRRIWEMLKECPIMDFPRNEAHLSLKDFVERVPEEFERWIITTSHALMDHALVIEATCFKAVEEVKDMPTRKDQAIYIMENYKDLSGIIFTILNKKPYEESIWKLLYPAHEVPFKAIGESNA